jgi:hypothetical protein
MQFSDRFEHLEHNGRAPSHYDSVKDAMAAFLQPHTYLAMGSLTFFAGHGRVLVSALFLFRRHAPQVQIEPECCGIEVMRIFRRGAVYAVRYTRALCRRCSQYQIADTALMVSSV